MKRPIHLTTTLLIGGALLAGCGGHPAKPHHARLAAQTFTYDAGDVGGFFKTVTGDPLKSEPSTEFDSLMPDRSDFDKADQMSQRYGSFLIYVLHGARADTIYKTQEGRPVRPDAQGIYWHDEGGQWEAMKPYKNVVLAWNADDRSVDARFRRLDAVLSHLGEPPAQAEAALPAEDRPCAAQGITPASDAEGTCREPSGKTVTLVNRDTRLKLPGLQVRVTRVETGRVVVPPRDYGLIKRAKGRFVLAALRLKNTGDGPLRDLYEVKLRIGNRTYDQSDEASWTVTPVDAFPIQPGDSGVAAVVFDVPVSAARQAVTQGVLAFPAGDDLSTVEDAAKLGEIRLARAAAAVGTKS